MLCESKQRTIVQNLVDAIYLDHGSYFYSFYSLVGEGEGWWHDSSYIVFTLGFTHVCILSQKKKNIPSPLQKKILYEPWFVSTSACIIESIDSLCRDGTDTPCKINVPKSLQKISFKHL